jgi:hypothetical protein
MVAVAVVDAVWTVRWSIALAAVAVRFSTKQFQPVAAVGSAMTPAVAEPPVPTSTRKAADVPDVTEGVVPNPELIVGAVADKARFAPRLRLVTRAVADQTGAVAAPCEIRTWPMAGAVNGARLVVELA